MPINARVYDNTPGPAGEPEVMPAHGGLPTRDGDEGGMGYPGATGATGDTGPKGPAGQDATSPWQPDQLFDPPINLASDLRFLLSLSL